MWGFEHKDFDNKFRYAQRYLNFIQYLRRQEIKRLYYLLPETSYSYHWVYIYIYIYNLLATMVRLPQSISN